jgi:acetyltransferase-like isoleucine patch superfamily enzyme
MRAAGPRRVAGAGALGVYRLAVRARNKLFSLSVAGSFESFGSHSVLELPVRIEGERRIRIGSGVFVGQGSWLHALDDPGAAADGASPGVALTIGDGTSIVGNCVLSAVHSIEIGPDVLFARGVYVSDHSHRYDDAGRPVLAQGVTSVAPVSIGAGAWLGENVVVLPGVRIGRGAVVGANAVVSRDVADYAVAVGVPAAEVKRFGPSPTPA